MKIRNIYNQITAPTIQDLWLYKGDLRYFGNKYYPTEIILIAIPK